MVINKIKSFSFFVFVFLVVGTVFGGVLITGTKVNLTNGGKSITSNTSNFSMNEKPNTNFIISETNSIKYGTCKVVLKCPPGEEKKFAYFLSDGCPLIECVISKKHMTLNSTFENFKVRLFENPTGIVLYFNIQDKDFIPGKNYFVNIMTDKGTVNVPIMNPHKIYLSSDKYHWSRDHVYSFRVLKFLPDVISGKVLYKSAFKWKFGKTHHMNLSATTYPGKIYNKSNVSLNLSKKKQKVHHGFFWRIFNSFFSII